jgi:outer membrane receptor protein involved in Fe transport
VEFYKDKSEFMSVEGKGLPVGFSVPSVASKEKLIGGSYEYSAMQSLISQFNMNYDKKYFLTASYRIDQTSNFPPQHRTANFPTIGLSWMASNEEFIKKLPAISFLKLRSSYGLTGDPDIGASRYMGLFDLNTQYNNNAAAVPLQLPNYNLTWEQTNAFNIGFDLGLFNRIDITFDFYNSITKNLIILVAQPLSQGFEYRWENAGTVTNQGIELGLNAKVVEAGDFNWDLGFTFAKNNNELSGIENPIFRSVNGVSQIYRNGGELYTFMLPKWLGVDTQTGAPVWEKITKDADGNIIKREPTSNYSEAEAQEVGSALPVFQGGLTTTISYRRFSLYANMAYQYGNKVYNFTRIFMDHDGHEPYYNYMEPKDDWSRWIKPGDVATHPSMQNAELSREHSSRFLEDGGFIKIRNVKLNYNFPKSISNKLKLQDLNLSFGVDNLYTFSNFWGQDPEVTLTQSDWSMPGVSDFKYPNSRLFVFSLNVKF